MVCLKLSRAAMSQQLVSMFVSDCGFNGISLSPHHALPHTQQQQFEIRKKKMT